MKRPKRFQIAKPAQAVVAKEIASGLASIQTFGDNDESLYIKDETNFFAQEFAVTEIISSEELSKLVKRVEKLVRSSYEYKGYLGYLYESLRIETCSIFSNIDMSEDVSLEFHHAPLTLFDICSIVISHRLNNNQPVTTLSVADEVMQAHCRNTIGLIPLSSTAHRLVHANILKIHHQQIIGDWVKFLREYSQGVTPEIVAKCLGFTRITEAEVKQSYEKLAFTPDNIRTAKITEMGRLDTLQPFLVSSQES